MTTLLRNLLHSSTAAQQHSSRSKIYYSNSGIVKVFTLLTFITSFTPKITNSIIKNFDIKELPTGKYNLLLYNNDGFIQNKSFIIVK